VAEVVELTAMEVEVVGAGADVVVFPVSLE
jgi:hypothetical protein